MGKDRVTLTVPSKGEFAKAVRMTAAALAARAGMTYDEVDDVRIAAEEAFIYAVETRHEGEEVSMTFILDDEAVEMEVCLGDEAHESGEEAERRAGYATFILQSVCDLYELASDEDGRPHLRLVKRAGVGDAG